MVLDAIFRVSVGEAQGCDGGKVSRVSSSPELGVVAAGHLREWSDSSSRADLEVGFEHADRREDAEELVDGCSCSSEWEPCSPPSSFPRLRSLFVYVFCKPVTFKVAVLPVYRNPLYLSICPFGVII